MSSQALKRYQQLIKDRPECFYNKGCLSIELDMEKLEAYKRDTGRELGVVYESEYHIMLVDLVYEKQGQYWCYERIIKKSTGPGIVVIPKYKETYILLRQFRHALREEQYAFPRGFGEDGLSGEENARKEIREEIGAEITAITYLGNVVADSGLCGDKVSVYQAEVTEPILNKDEEGIQEILYVTGEELVKMIKSGEIKDGFTLSAYMLYL